LHGLRERAEKKEIRAMWIAFHPQLVGEDACDTIAELKGLLAALEFSVVSTTHDFEWARAASVLLPMASWAEEKGTYTNYAGRIQITNRAVMPPGDAQPLHFMIAELLNRSNAAVSDDPSTIFESIAREVPRYGGLDYDAIGPLGTMPAEAPQEVLR
jgi:predicted molibdopterin-dependent oxidoreductase YjgC